MINLKNVKKIKHQTEYVGARISKANKDALESKCLTIGCSVSSLIAELISQFVNNSST